jgi:hypothetical protein
MIGQRFEVPTRVLEWPCKRGEFEIRCRVRRAGLNEGNRIVHVVGEEPGHNRGPQLELIGSGNVVYWVTPAHGKSGETIGVGSDELVSWVWIGVTPSVRSAA